MACSATAHRSEPRKSPKPDAALVPGIQMHRGYVLCVQEIEDGDGFWQACYLAIGENGEEHQLNVSRTMFVPTQARFNWLVDMGFPPGVIYGAGADRLYGPICNASIDNAMAKAEHDAGLTAPCADSTMADRVFSIVAGTCGGLATYGLGELLAVAWGYGA